MPFVALADALLGLFLQKEDGEGHFSVAHCPYRFLFDRLSHVTPVIPVHDKKIRIGHFRTSLLIPRKKIRDETSLKI